MTMMVWVALAMALDGFDGVGSICWNPSSEGKMVGAVGFEPTTSWSRTKRATKLRYAPTYLNIKHFRLDSSGGYYALIKKVGKQFRQQSFCLLM